MLARYFLSQAAIILKKGNVERCLEKGQMQWVVIRPALHVYYVFPNGSVFSMY